VVRTDGRKLKQILENLIHNAIKFTDEGGVTVTAQFRADDSREATGDGKDGGESLSPRASRLGSHAFVEFKVADTGRGIAVDALPIIFEKFRQADSSETRLFGGVGLGLYIAKNFTELLGGSIDVQTTVGQGSIFTVTIPCTLPALVKPGLEQDSATDVVRDNRDTPSAPLRVERI
jgi:signal transduction histidine kinase